MSQPFLGEIQMFAGNFAPRGYAFCQGQILPIQQYTALFSLIGTYYGGNGSSTFALPNLEGLFPVGQGQGPGLTDRVIGETGGSATVTLIQTPMPVHTHAIWAATAAKSGQAKTPAANTCLGSGAPTDTIYGPASGGSNMSAAGLQNAGSSAAHNNLPPYQVLNFIIALTGIYPPRN